jgi:hypothetical protein
VNLPTKARSEYPARTAINSGIALSGSPTISIIATVAKASDGGLGSPSLVFIPRLGETPPVENLLTVRSIQALQRATCTP